MVMVVRVNTEMGASFPQALPIGRKRGVDLRERSYKVLRNMAGIAAALPPQTTTTSRGGIVRMIGGGDDSGKTICEVP